MDTVTVRVVSQEIAESSRWDDPTGSLGNEGSVKELCSTTLETIMQRVISTAETANLQAYQPRLWYEIEPKQYPAASTSSLNGTLEFAIPPHQNISKMPTVLRLLLP